jgi:hypothetical protein
VSRGWWLDEKEPEYFRRAHGRGVLARRAPEPAAAPTASAKAGRPTQNTDEEDAPKPPSWVGVTGPLAALLIVAGAAIGVGLGNNNVLGALIVVPVLAGITALIGRRLAEIDGNPLVFQIVMAGFVVKCAGVVIRYVISFTLYGASDATEYDKFGRQIGRGLRHGELISQGGHWAGTNFVRLLTGIFYTVTPMSKLSGFMIFGWLSYLGVLLFWRAYRKAISDRNDLTFLQWVVLIPTMVYWPSALGKDAWMVLCLGLAAYGVACILTTRPLLGWIAFAGGIAGVSEVRPHLGLSVVAGLVLAMLFRKWPQKGKFAALIAVGLVIVAGMVVVSQASHFLGVGVFSQKGIQKELNDVKGRTGEGGSEFHPIPVHSPVQFPPAAVTVLFRPFLFEAHNPQSLGVAIEETVLLVAFIVNRKRWLRALRLCRSRPYVLYCIGAISTFVIAYSSFSNFGLIARQRAQIMPLLLVLLVFPKAEEEAPEDAPPPSGRRPRGNWTPAPATQP